MCTLSISIDSVELYRVFKTTFIDHLGTIIKAVIEVSCPLGCHRKVTFYSSALHPCLCSPTVVPDLQCAVNEYGLGALHPLRAPLDTWILSASAKPLLIFPDSTQMSIIGSLPWRWGLERQLSSNIPMAPLFLGSSYCNWNVVNSILIVIQIVWALMVHHNLRVTLKM